MGRVELPGDGWAELVDPASVSERKRRPVTRLSVTLGNVPGFRAAFEGGGVDTVTGEVVDVMNDLNDAIVVALVDSWSYPYPVTLDGLLDLPGPAYDRLREVTAPSVKDLLPDFGVSPESDSPT